MFEDVGDAGVIRRRRGECHREKVFGIAVVEMEDAGRGRFMGEFVCRAAEIWHGGDSPDDKAVDFAPCLQ